MATHIDGSMKSSPEGGTITFAAVPSIEEIDQRGTEERRKVRFARRKYSSRRPPCLCGERSLPYMRLPYLKGGGDSRSAWRSVANDLVPLRAQERRRDD